MTAICAAANAVVTTTVHTVVPTPARYVVRTSKNRTSERHLLFQCTGAMVVGAEWGGGLEMATRIRLQP